MRYLRLLIIVVIALSGLVGAATVASAGDQHDQNLVCSGGTLTPNLNPTLINPGTYDSITVTGACLIPFGTVNVRENLRIKPDAVLVANFPGGPNNNPPEGDAILNVRGDVSVGRGATLIMGCAPSFGCVNTTTDQIGGDLTADHPLGVVLHGDTIRGDFSIRGGGGQAYDCAPKGDAFVAFMSPVFSTMDDSKVSGDFSVSGYQSCWFGFARDWIGGDVQVSNNALGDPDAIEILSNTIRGDLTCRGNKFADASKTPVVFTLHGPWDSTEAPNGDLFPRQPAPNTVMGERSGQCVLATPVTPNLPPGPGPF